MQISVGENGGLVKVGGGETTVKNHRLFEDCHFY